MYTQRNYLFVTLTIQYGQNKNSFLSSKATSDDSMIVSKSLNLTPHPETDFALKKMEIKSILFLSQKIRQPETACWNV